MPHVVAAEIEITPWFDSNASISTSKAFKVCSRVPRGRPPVRRRDAVPTASNSSMKMIRARLLLEQVAHAARAYAHKHLNEIGTGNEKNGTFASPARAHKKSCPFPEDPRPARALAECVRQASGGRLRVLQEIKNNFNYVRRFALRP